MVLKDTAIRSTESGHWLRGFDPSSPTTYQGSEAVPFQRWFKFKEAFSPSLVQSIIESFPVRPKSILDCCAGSGTTGMVAHFMGIRPWLMEVNPFLADLADAKLTDYSDYDLPRETAKLISRFHNARVAVSDIRARLPPTFVEPGVDERWLFSRSVAKQIERLKIAIEAAHAASIRRFFRVALGRILIGLSSVRMDGKGRRYRQNWKARPIDPDQVLAQFLANVNEMIADVCRYTNFRAAPTSVIRGDARRLLPEFREAIDAAIFSPPYPNSFDHTDIYNIELWVLGYFESAQDNRSLRLRTIRSHVQVGWPTPMSEASGLLAKTISRLNAKRKTLWNPRLPQMVHAYFEDLFGMLSEIRRCLRKNGHIVIVLGDSSYAGVKIASSAILEEFAASLGMTVEATTSVRVMRSSMQQQRGKKALDEWLIRLRRID